LLLVFAYESLPVKCVIMVRTHGKVVPLARARRISVRCARPPVGSQAPPAFFHSLETKPTARARRGRVIRLSRLSTTNGNVKPQAQEIDAHVDYTLESTLSSRAFARR
jgi:hypothetical protein